MSHRHAPFYCEENVWWLNRDPAFEARRRWVVFITNAQRTCAMRHQRAAPAGEWLAWDYHVVLLVEAEDGTLEVFDPDCRLGMPLALVSYLDASFHQALPPRFQPRFRVVDGVTFDRTFASDRSHMRTAEGAWRHPPPPWSPIGEGSTLERFLDLDDDGLGPWCGRDTLAEVVAGGRGDAPRPHSR